MRQNYHALENWYLGYGRMPRKLKKKFLNRKIKRKQLRHQLATYTLGEGITTMYERREIIPYGVFCHKCGEPHYYGGGNKTSYPEHWEYFRCIRCNTIVGYIDNSAFCHALECKENNYDPVF